MEQTSRVEGNHCGLMVRVQNAYIAGEGILHALLFGLVVSLVNLRGAPEVAQGELMRFLAEAAWYPARCCRLRVCNGKWPGINKFNQIVVFCV